MPTPGEVPMLCRISGSTVGQLGMRPHGTSGILTPRAHACARPRVAGGEVCQSGGPLSHLGRRHRYASPRYAV